MRALLTDTGESPAFPSYSTPENDFPRFSKRVYRPVLVGIRNGTKPRTC